MKKRTKVNISDRLGGGGVRGLTTINADQRERGHPQEREPSGKRIYRQLEVEVGVEVVISVEVEIIKADLKLDLELNTLYC